MTSKSLLKTSIVAGAVLSVVACSTADQYLGDEAPGASACEEDCSAIAVGQCLQSVCDPTTRACKFVTAADGTACDDGLFCTIGEVCNNGVCGDGQPNPCGSTDCKIGVCNEEEDTCLTTLQVDDTPCTVESDLCQIGARCHAGECIGTPKNCSLAPGMDDCHVAVCNPTTGACEVSIGNDGARCEDDACGYYKTCRGGVCQGGINKSHWSFTSDATVCQMEVCDPATGLLTRKTAQIGEECLYDSNGSGFECTVGQCAAGGACVRIPKVGAPCNAISDDCNVGTCSVDGFCSPLPAREGMPCDDRNLCTEATTCQGGSCSGRLKPGVEVYFSDTFENGNKGWTGPFVTKWSIRPPLPLELQYPFLGGLTLGVANMQFQPEVDHTATLANVFLASNGANAGDYIESPVIDSSKAAGDVYLTAWRAITIPDGGDLILTRGPREFRVI